MAVVLCPRLTQAGRTPLDTILTGLRPVAPWPQIQKYWARLKEVRAKRTALEQAVAEAGGGWGRGQLLLQAHDPL